MPLQEAQQPGDVAGLAAAVVWRYGRLLWRHYSNFVYTLNSFNLLQVGFLGLSFFQHI